MKLFSICLLILLTSCQSFKKNEDNIKKAAHDVVDEAIDGVDKKTSKK